MKNLLSTNCFDTKDIMIIAGTCLKNMQPNAYNELLNISDNIHEICLEETHMNMAVTKIIGMIARKNIKQVIFATVDKSPHCVQLHYIVKEIENMLDVKDIEFKNYVAVNNELIEIPLNVISLSKNLSGLKNIL